MTNSINNNKCRHTQRSLQPSLDYKAQPVPKGSRQIKVRQNLEKNGPNAATNVSIDRPLDNPIAAIAALAFSPSSMDSAMNSIANATTTVLTAETPRCGLNTKKPCLTCADSDSDSDSGSDNDESVKIMFTKKATYQPIQMTTKTPQRMTIPPTMMPLTMTVLTSPGYLTRPSNS